MTWTEEQVRAHVFVCVLALVIERVMRFRLKRAKSGCSPATALDELRRLTHVQLSFDGKQQSRQILANKAPFQLDIFDALKVERFTDARLKKLTATGTGADGCHVPRSSQSRAGARRRWKAGSVAGESLTSRTSRVAEVNPGFECGPHDRCRVAGSVDGEPVR